MEVAGIVFIIPAIVGLFGSAVVAFNAYAGGEQWARPFGRRAIVVGMVSFVGVVHRHGLDSSVVTGFSLFGRRIPT